MEPTNPFVLNGYSGPDYFCDRNKETDLLINNSTNGINTTLLSIRRMGKTGLLQHAVQELHRRKKGIGIYVDIFDTENLKDFTNRLATAIFKTFPQKNRLWKATMDLLKNLRPVISYDELTGTPEVTLDYSQPKQFEHSLLNIFSFLERNNRLIILAIDEFQQITNYPEKNVEAFLRSRIQELKNVKFIFSGSSPHMLTQMFHNASRPFFASTHTLFLDKIAYDEYSGFIRNSFQNHKKKINTEAIDFILKFTLQHTFYTQAVCNKIFASGNKKITLQDAQTAAFELLNQNEPVFFQYRTMLTSNQWNMLRAIAKEGTVYQPHAQKLIQKYNLGTPSSVQRNVEALLNKEMIYKLSDDKTEYYRVYDCFLMRWLERS